MSSELHQVMQTIIDSKTPVMWLELVDGYIDLFNRSPKTFILPAPHANLSVAIEHFHDDTLAFRNFIRKVRDEVEKSQRIDVHKFYRKVNTRVSQRILRDRKYTAIQKIEQHLGIEFAPGQRDAVYAWLTQYWGKSRSDFLAEHRINTPEKRLSSEQRTELSEQFWDKVDDDLANNIFPIPPEVVYVKLASLESYKPDSI